MELIKKTIKVTLPTIESVLDQKDFPYWKVCYQGTISGDKILSPLDTALKYVRRHYIRIYNNPYIMSLNFSSWEEKLIDKLVLELKLKTREVYHGSDYFDLYEGCSGFSKGAASGDGWENYEKIEGGYNQDKVIKSLSTADKGKTNFYVRITPHAFRIKYEVIKNTSYQSDNYGGFNSTTSEPYFVEIEMKEIMYRKIPYYYFTKYE